MMKIYTNETKTSKEFVKSPKQDVINSILNFSKSLEVFEIKNTQQLENTKIEVILN